MIRGDKHEAARRNLVDALLSKIVARVARELFEKRSAWRVSKVYWA